MRASVAHWKESMGSGSQELNWARLTKMQFNNIKRS